MSGPVWSWQTSPAELPGASPRRSGDVAATSLTFPALLNSVNDCLLLISHDVFNACMYGFTRARPSPSNVPRVRVPLVRTPRKRILPLFMTPCASASQPMGWSSYGAGIYSNTVEPNQVPSGICILQLFLLACLEEQRPGSGVYGSSAHGILPAAFPGGRAAWRGGHRVGNNNLPNEEVPKAQPPACPSLSGGWLGLSQCSGWLGVMKLPNVINQGNAETELEARRRLGRSF